MRTQAEGCFFAAALRRFGKTSENFTSKRRKINKQMIENKFRRELKMNDRATVVVKKNKKNIAIYAFARNTGFDFDRI